MGILLKKMIYCNFSIQDLSLADQFYYTLYLMYMHDQIYMYVCVYMNNSKVSMW